MTRRFTFHRIMATTVLATTTILILMAGEVATCAKSSYWLKNDGTLWAFGRNQEYQLGDRSNTERTQPVQTLEQGTKMANCHKIVTGEDCAFVIKTDGTLWVFGNGIKGQLGIGTVEQKYATDIQMGYRQKVKLLVTSNLHTLAVTEENELYTWGNNDYGQLGDEQGAKILSQPRQRLSDVPIRSAAVGSNHSLALSTDNRLYAFGRNNNGQLCDGTTTDAPQPKLVMTDVVSIAAGGDYSAVIKTDGSLWVNQNAGWQMARIMDSNAKRALIADGRIYIITKNNELWIGNVTGFPTKVLDNVERIAARGTLAFAIQYDGTLYDCSGTPKQVMTNVAKVATSGEHTLALKHDGYLYAWGKNEQGQLGVGSHREQTSPIMVGQDYTPESMGIDETTGQLPSGPVRIYNLQGQRVATTSRQFVADDLQQLPVGVYVAGGKKWIVRK